MRNATVLTTIPGFYANNDLAQVEIDYVPTSTKQTVSYWSERGDLRFIDLLDMEDPIMIHSFVLAALATDYYDDMPHPIFQFDAWVHYAAKETLELIKPTGAMDDYSRKDLYDVLANFEGLPEVGLEEALTGRNTPWKERPTCLEETSFFWSSLYRGNEDLFDIRDRATNPRVKQAIGIMIND